MVLVLGLASACSTADDPQPLLPLTPRTSVVPTTFPIEVMPLTEADFDPDLGAGQFYSADLEIDLGGADLVDLDADGRLYVQGHGLGYRDGHMVRDLSGDLVLDKDGKASVWLGDSASVGDPDCPWIDLTNDQAGLTMYTPEAYYGGIGGGFRTVRLELDLSLFTNAQTGATCLSSTLNTIRFRFNGTDGVSSGYRILDFNVIDGSDTELLPIKPLPEEDPSTWASPLPTDPDAVAGAGLFASATLWNNPIDQEYVEAACADCHAWDGRDLEYFAYSDHSIVSRAVFHGLTETQGEQIAAYVRSHAAQRQGRPWNPPYQPGVGVDVAGAWSAGAGLGAVLDDELDQGELMVQQLFGTTTPTQTDVEDTIRGTALPQSTINMRTLPVAIQLPDWNSWLPEVHPMDLWGEAYWRGDHAGTDVFDTRVSTFYAGNGPTAMVAQDFDADGAMDLAIAAKIAGHRKLLRGAADDSMLSFSESWSSTGDAFPLAVITADFDADGIPDLVYSHFIGDTVHLLLGNDDGSGKGDGTFTLAQSISLDSPQGLGAADFDGDGELDLAVALTFPQEVEVLWGAGGGTLGASTTLPATGGPTDIVLADFDGNGRQDVAAASYLGDVLLTSFAPDRSYASITQSTSTGLVDIYAGTVVGAHADLVTLHDTGTMELWVGDGAGGFGSGGQLTVDADAVAFTFGDFGEGPDIDIAVANETSNTIDIFTGDGAGGFSHGVTLATGNRPSDVVAGNFDEHEGLDLAVLELDDDTVSLLVPWARDPQQVYEDLAADLPAMPLSDIRGRLDGMHSTAKAYVATGMWRPNLGTPASLGTLFGYRGDRGLVLDRAVLRGYNHELAKRNVAQWVSVKLWELIQDNGLEEVGNQVGVYGALGEARSWPVDTWTVHTVAPHITSVNDDNFRHPSDYVVSLPDVDESAADACAGHYGDPDPTYQECDYDTIMSAAQYHLKGEYDSTAWYHLQLILQPGSRSIDRSLPASPVDVAYAYVHVHGLSQYVHLPNARDVLDTGGTILPHPAAPWEGLRYLATMIKVYQMRNNAKGPVQTGWAMRDVSPRLFVSAPKGQDDIEIWEQLDAYELNGLPTGSRAMVTNALLRVFLEVVSSDPVFHPDAWPRCANTTAGESSPTTEAWGACEPPSAGSVRDTWANVDPPNYEVRVTNGMVSHFGAGYFSAATEAAAVPGKVYPNIAGAYLHSADDVYRAIPYLIEAGADTTLVGALISWAEAMWPGPDWVLGMPRADGGNDWDELRTLNVP